MGREEQQSADETTAFVQLPIINISYRQPPVSAKLLNPSIILLARTSAGQHQRRADTEMFSPPQSMDFDQRSASAAICNLESTVSVRPQMNNYAVC